MDKEEALEVLENGMTVGEAIATLKKFDEDLLLVNTRSNENLPVSDISETDIDYCYDEIISKHIVSIW